MMVGMAIQTIYMIVDMVFVGRVGSRALQALAFNMPLVFFGLGVTFGLSSGVTAMVARFVGAGDKPQADNSAMHAVGLGLVVAAILTAAGLLWGRPLLSALGVPGELAPVAWSYLRIIAAGYSFLVMSVFFRSILSGEGDMKTPMMIQGGGTLLNIALDPIFIFSLGLGVSGAALATVISQAVVTAIFVVLLFVKQHSYVTFSRRDFRFSGPILGGILKLGLPASASFLIIALGGGVFNRLLSGLSTQAVAAYQVGLRLDHLFMLPIISVATGMVTLVAMFRGAGEDDAIRAVVGYSMSRMVLLAVAIGAVFYVAAPSMVAPFSDDGAIRSLGTAYLRTIVLGYPFAAVAILSGRILQGLGHGVPVLVLSALRVVLLSAPLAYLFVYGMGKPVGWVWAAMVLGVMGSALVAVPWLRWVLSPVAGGSLSR